MNARQERHMAECVYCGLIASTLTEHTALLAADEHHARHPQHPVLTVQTVQVRS